MTRSGGSRTAKMATVMAGCGRTRCMVTVVGMAKTQALAEEVGTPTEQYDY